MNAEVTESSNGTLLRELEDARTTIARLSAHHARSIGWETRLKGIIQERDDLQQERDQQVANARIADQRTAVLKEKCGTSNLP